MLIKPIIEFFKAYKDMKRYNELVDRVESRYFVSVDELTEYCNLKMKYNIEEYGKF